MTTQIAEYAKAVDKFNFLERLQIQKAVITRQVCHSESAEQAKADALKELQMVIDSVKH